MKGKFFVLASLLAMVVLIGLTLLPVVRAQESLTPAPTGPYQIGTVSYHWIDESREEKFTPENNEDKRELIVQFWYPAEVGAEANATEYLSHAEDFFSALNSIWSGAAINIKVSGEELVGYQSHAFANAPLAAGEDTYPVLIFSPGRGATPQMYAAQLEELASHGYIVAGITHPYISAITFLPDGRTALFANDSSYTDSAIVTQDQIFVLDQLEILNADDPEDLFTDRLDLDRIGLFGHHLGGGASVQTCSQDSRCKAGAAEAAEAGDLYGDVIVKGFDQPFMFLSSDSGVFDPGPSYRKARGPVYSLGITGMLLMDFTDFPFLPPSALTIGPGWLGEIESERSIEIMRTYLLAFFDTYLKGETSDLLEGASDEYPEVDIQMENT